MRYEHLSSSNLHSNRDAAVSHSSAQTSRESQYASDAASKELKKTLENADVSVLPLDQVVLRTVQQIKLNKQVKNANPVIEAGDLDIMPQKRTCERRGRIGFSAKE